MCSTMQTRKMDLASERKLVNVSFRLHQMPLSKILICTSISRGSMGVTETTSKVSLLASSEAMNLAQCLARVRRLKQQINCLIGNVYPLVEQQTLLQNGMLPQLIHVDLKQSTFSQTLSLQRVLTQVSFTSIKRILLMDMMLTSLRTSRTKIMQITGSQGNLLILKHSSQECGSKLRQVMSFKNSMEGSNKT